MIRKFIVQASFIIAIYSMAIVELLASEQDKYVIYAGIYPPFVQEDNKGSTDIIIQEIFEAAGIEVEIIHVPIRRLGRVYVGNDKVAGIYAPQSLALSYGKKEELIIGKPFQLGRFLFWYYKPNFKNKIKWQQLSDLKGYKISTPLGSLLTPKLISAGLDVDYSPNTDAHIRKLVTKRADLSPLFYLAATDTILKYYPEKQQEFSYLEKPISFAKYSLILNKDFPQTDKLMKYYHIGFNKLVKDGTYLKLLEDLYGKNNILKEYQALIFSKLNYSPAITYK